MTEEPTTEETTLAVGIGNGGVLLIMKKGEVELSVTLDIDEAYSHQGHVLAGAITLEQSIYIQRMQEQAATQRMMSEIMKKPEAGEKLWHP